MRVLLINPPFTEYGGLEGQGGKSAPLNLAYLASYLRKEKPYTKISILDCENLRLKYPEIENRIKEYQPDVMGITMPTPVYTQGLEVAKIAKWINPNIKVVVGGPHPTAFPKEVSGEPCIDAAVYGEGEKTFTNLVDAFENGYSLKSIKGIAYNTYLNPPQPLIENLDTIPFPARDLLPLDVYYAPPTKRETNTPNANIISSRGCPYNCTYCMSRIIWQKKVRFRSVQNVIDEIKECINKYGRGEFNFNDELFTLNRKRTLEFCDMVAKCDLRISWVCALRVDYVWGDVLYKMKEAGCKKVMFGFESGSQKVLDLMKKGTTLKQAEEAVKTTKRIGIKTSGAFMIGNIGETEETVRETINFAKKLNVDTVSFYVASPYPGTEFYNTAKEKGYLRKGLRWKDFSLIIGQAKPPLNLPGMTSQRIAYWQKRAYREYYLNPKFLWTRLKRIRSWIDIKNLIDGFKTFRKVI